jgi:hypothetical protein
VALAHGEEEEVGGLSVAVGERARRRLYSALASRCPKFAARDSAIARMR